MNASPYFGFEQLGRSPNFEIALNMSLEQLRFYCTSNEVFRPICMDQEFWLERLRREYPRTISYKPVNITWAQYYLEAPIINQLLSITGLTIPEDMNLYQVAQELEYSSIKIVFVAYNGQIIGAILMFPTDALIDVSKRAFNLLLPVDPEFDPATTRMDLMKLATEPTTGYEDVIIESIPFRFALSMRIESVLNILDENHSLWNDLQVIHFYQRGLYPQGFIFYQQ